jgi:hypothetical protein
MRIFEDDGLLASSASNDDLAATVVVGQAVVPSSLHHL